MSKYTERVARGECGLCGRPCGEGPVCSECRRKKRERLSRRTSDGLCRDCGNSVSKGHARCSSCLKKRKELDKARVAAGRCCKCEASVVPGKTYCLSCLEKKKETRRRKLKSAYATKYLGDPSRWHELESIWDAQQGLCKYTKLPMVLGKDCQLDHIIPRSKGGKNEISNYQWVLREINLMKFNMSEEEFINLCKAVASHS